MWREEKDMTNCSLLIQLIFFFKSFSFIFQNVNKYKVQFTLSRCPRRYLEAIENVYVTFYNMIYSNIISKLQICM